MNLENQEYEVIAALKDNFGYKLVLDRIKAEVDNTQGELLKIGDPINKELICYWRALHKIYEILSFLPEEMEKELKILQEQNQMTFYEDITAAPSQYVGILQNIYENKRLKK